MEKVSAFRWKDGHLYGLALNGEAGNDMEYLYVHLQKRSMKFTPGLEDEDSFMIVPNEFVRDHELTQEEISRFLTPDPQYEAAMRRKYSHKPLGERIKNFLQAGTHAQIMRLRRRWHRLIGKKLVSMWPIEPEY